MIRSQIAEFHYIAHFENLSSILALGILSHNEVSRRRICPKDISNFDVQERRADVQIPNGLALHDYVNLYFNARNSMMCVVTDAGKRNLNQTVVLCVSPDVLDIPNAVIADRNAATVKVRFEPAATGLQKIDENVVVARSWNDPDIFTKENLKQRMCAELLIPNNVPPQFIRSVYVATGSTLQRVAADYPNVTGILNPDLFFA